MSQFRTNSLCSSRRGVRTPVNPSEACWRRAGNRREIRDFSPNTTAMNRTCWSWSGVCKLQIENCKLKTAICKVPSVGSGGGTLMRSRLETLSNVPTAHGPRPTADPGAKCGAALVHQWTDARNRVENGQERPHLGRLGAIPTGRDSIGNSCPSKRIGPASGIPSRSGDHVAGRAQNGHGNGRAVFTIASPISSSIGSRARCGQWPGLSDPGRYARTPEWSDWPLERIATTNRIFSKTRQRVPVRTHRVHLPPCAPCQSRRRAGQ
jgi:hypothetical protein